MYAYIPLQEWAKQPEQMVAMHNHVALPMPCLVSHPCYLRTFELHKPWDPYSPVFGPPNFSCFLLPLCFCTDYSLHQGNPWPTPVTSCKKISWPFKTELGTFLKVTLGLHIYSYIQDLGWEWEGGGEAEKHLPKKQMCSSQFTYERGRTGEQFSKSPPPNSESK